MKRQVTLVTALVFVIVGFSTAAFAWAHHGQGHGKQGYGKRGCLSEYGGEARANLTEDQRIQLRDLHQRFIDETAETRAAMHGKKEEMRILMQTSTPDQQRILGLANETGDLKKALMEKRINLTLEAKKIAPEINFPAFDRGFDRGFGRGHGKRGAMDCPRIYTQQND